MRTHRPRPHLFAPLVIAALVACSDDPTSPVVGDELTEAEVGVMLGVLMESGGLGPGALGLGFDGAQAPAATEGGQSFVIEETSPCPNGGSVTFSGDGSVGPEGESFAFDLTQFHDGCGATSSEDGSQWTFDGAPSITTSLSGSVTETDFDLQGSQSGGLDWRTGSRSGSCSIELSFSFSASDDDAGGTFSGAISGSVCAVDVSQSFEFTD